MQCGLCVCAVCSVVPVYMWYVALYLYLLMGGKDIRRDARKLAVTGVSTQCLPCYIHGSSLPNESTALFSNSLLGRHSSLPVETRFQS